MNPERGPNPYAPPQSDVTPRLRQAASSKRPASWKWALALALCFAIGYAMTMRNVIVLVGWAGLELSWMDGLDLILRLTCLFALLAGSGKPWGLYLGSTALACFALMSGWNLWRTYTGYPDPVMRLIGMILIGLMLRLWYCFTFGQPSRRYHGLLSQASAEPSPMHE